MKSGSDLAITFEGILLLGKYNRKERTGIIEGESISFSEQSSVSTENIVSASYPSVQDAGNRVRTIELTTVEYFDTPQDAQAALVAHEQAWAEIGRKGTLTISGIGSWVAGVQSRTPAILRHTVLQVSYSLVCGKKL